VVITLVLHTKCPQFDPGQQQHIVFFPYLQTGSLVNRTRQKKSRKKKLTKPKLTEIGCEVYRGHKKISGFSLLF
jgi:hypothetical protein